MDPIIISYDAETNPENPGWVVLTPDGWQPLDGPGTWAAPTDEGAHPETLAPFARRAYAYHTGDPVPLNVPVKVEQ